MPHLLEEHISICTALHFWGNPPEISPYLSLLDMGFICSWGVSLVGAFTLSLGSSGMWPLWKTDCSDRQEKLCQQLSPAAKAVPETEPAALLCCISVSSLKFTNTPVFGLVAQTDFPSTSPTQTLSLLLTLFFSLCFDFLFSFDLPGLLWVLTGWLLLLESPFMRWLLPPIIPLHLSKPHLQSCCEEKEKIQ